MFEQTTRNGDRVRAAALLASMVLQFAAGILGGIGAGAESVGTVANSYPNPLLPAGTAFTIWTLIYVATLVTAIRHCSPSQLGREVQRAIGWKLAAAGVLNAAWIVVFSNRWILLAEVVIVALLTLLAFTHRAVGVQAAAGFADRLTIHLPIAIYTGWVSAAAVVGLVTTITAGGGTVTATVAVVLLALATVPIAAAVWLGNAKAGYAGAVVWALSWVAVNAAGGVVVAAVTCAAVAVLAAAAATWRSPAPARALLG